MGIGWRNDDKHKSVPISPNVRTHTSTGRTTPGFDLGRAQGSGVRGTGVNRNAATITTNQKKGRA